MFGVDVKCLRRHRTNSIVYPHTLTQTVYISMNGLLHAQERLGHHLQSGMKLIRVMYHMELLLATGW